jgi:hypothetical protein
MFPIRHLAAVLAFAVAAAACGGGEGAVATVDGTDIVLDDLRELRVSYQGDGLQTDNDQFRGELSRMIFGQAALGAAEQDLGIVLTDADVDARLADPPERWQPSFDQVAAAPDLTDEALRREALISLLQDEVTGALVRAEDGYLAAVLSQPRSLLSACIRHILVGDAAAATAALTRIEQGEGFAAVAAEVSTDAASAPQGGLLADPQTGCLVPLSRWIEPFGEAAMTAPLGEAVGPVETEFGFHVILVEERTELPTLAQLEANPMAWLDVSTYSLFFTPWFNEIIRSAEITVNPFIGTWSEEPLGVLPPDA